MHIFQTIYAKNDLPVYWNLRYSFRTSLKCELDILINVNHPFWYVLSLLYCLILDRLNLERDSIAFHWGWWWGLTNFMDTLQNCISSCLLKSEMLAFLLLCGEGGAVLKITFQMCTDEVDCLKDSICLCLVIKIF